MRTAYAAGRWILAALLLTAPGLPAAASCPPAGWTAAQLDALKQAGFQGEPAKRRQSLALGLLACLADPDPALRDALAFEAWSTWLRGNALDERTRHAAVARLLPALDPGAGDAAGFRQPFSALVLSELARADRKSPYLSSAQRQALVEAAARYLETVRDYRGFDAAQGWRHGVAHGSDLLMQLALNEALTRAQLDRITAAVATQVAPAGEHFYVYGESGRLARPLLFAAMRGLQPDDYWSAWFRGIAAPGPLPAWSQAYLSQAGLARRHNTRAFLLEVYAAIRDSKNPKLVALIPAVTAALASVP